MKELKYSAGAVSKGFWFIEFKKYMEIFLEGKSHEEIREKQLTENFLMSPSEDYGKRAIGELFKRISALPQSVIDIFTSLSVDDQKLINLIGIMLTDRLFFELIYEVYRENIILGKREFEDSEIRAFFNQKANQSDKVASFSIGGKNRLVGAYKTYMREGNLLKEEKITVYNRVIMDLRIEDILKQSAYIPYYKALAGGE